jgi:hypothetical protein
VKDEKDDAEHIDDMKEKRADPNSDKVIETKKFKFVSLVEPRDHCANPTEHQNDSPSIGRMNI